MSEQPGKQIESARQLPTSDLIGILRERLEQSPEDQDLLGQISALNTTAQELTKATRSISAVTTPTTADAQPDELVQAPESEADYFAKVLQDNETYYVEGYSNWGDWIVNGKPMKEIFKGDREGYGYIRYGPRTNTTDRLGTYPLFVPYPDLTSHIRNEKWKGWGAKTSREGTSFMARWDTTFLTVAPTLTKRELPEQSGSYYGSKIGHMYDKFIEKLPDDQQFCGVSYTFNTNYLDPGGRSSGNATFGFLLTKDDAERFISGTAKNSNLPNELFDKVFPGLVAPGQLDRQPREKLFVFDLNSGLKSLHISNWEPTMVLDFPSPKAT